MHNCFSEITFACLRDLNESYDQKHDLSAILAAILNLDNLYEQTSTKCVGDTFGTNILVLL